MKEFLKGFKWFDIAIVLLPILYTFIFIKYIVPIFMSEILYFQIVSIVLLVGFYGYAIFWFKKGNKGK